MPHLKRANAMVTHPRVTGRGWDGVRRVASSGSSSKNLTDQAREILGESLSSDKFLFSHCTIVASVDTDVVPGIKLGKIKVGSTTVDRRYSDYHIKTGSSLYVNNNGDSWSRGVLLASYPTFIGGNNFQEHVQIEEKSKGRIIDAVARDIGDSVYIDILVATNRKHAQLVADIESEKMGTLSMGCTTEFTICSKCGHFAVDETDLCEHIRYSKLNTFMDDNGQKRVVAELCGHVTYKEKPEAPGGVRFIEASWVAVPAFQGAVMRNILKTGDLNIEESELRKLLAAPVPSWSDTAISKAANGPLPRGKVSDEFGDEGGGDAPAAPAPEAPPFKDLEDSVYQMVKDRVKTRITDEMKKKQVSEATKPDVAVDWPNDTIIKEGSARKTSSVSENIQARMKKEAQVRYFDALNTLVRVASSDAALVEGIASINSSYGLQIPPRAYRVALKLGSIDRYPDRSSLLRACRKAASGELSPAEYRVVVRVGTLLSRWESINNPVPVSPSRSSS